MWKAKVHKVDLASIEDAIKERQREAQKLQQEINGYAANARDVLSSLESAEKSYERAKAAFKDFQNLEEDYQKHLDRSDDNYRLFDQNTAFGKLNRLADINLELKRYGAKTFEPSEARVKEMRNAWTAWKSQNFPKIK